MHGRETEAWIARVLSEQVSSSSAGCVRGPANLCSAEKGLVWSSGRRPRASVPARWYSDKHNRVHALVPLFFQKNRRHAIPYCVRTTTSTLHILPLSLSQLPHTLPCHCPRHPTPTFSQHNYPCPAALQRCSASAPRSLSPVSPCGVTLLPRLYYFGDLSYCRHFQYYFLLYFLVAGLSHALFRSGLFQLPHSRTELCPHLVKLDLAVRFNVLPAEDLSLGSFRRDYGVLLLHNDQSQR